MITATRFIRISLEKKKNMKTMLFKEENTYGTRN